MLKEIQSFCPRYTYNFNQEGHFHSEKRILFPSTLFLYLDESDRKTVLRTRGVNNFLYWLNAPVTVPHKDISNIYNLMNSFSNLELERCKVDSSRGSETLHCREGELFVLRLNVMGYRIVAKRTNSNLEKNEPVISGERYKLPAFTLNNSLNLAQV